MKIPRLPVAFLTLNLLFSSVCGAQVPPIDFFDDGLPTAPVGQPVPRSRDSKRGITVKVVPKEKVPIERAPAPVLPTRAYALQNIRAEELGMQIKQMLQSRAPKVTVGESLIVNGSDDVLKLVTECISILDAEQPTSNFATPQVRQQRNHEITQTSFRIPEYRNPLDLTRNGRTPDQELEILQRETKSLRKVHAFFEEQVSIAVKNLAKARTEAMQAGKGPGTEFGSTDEEIECNHKLLSAVADVFRTRQRLQLNELREYSQRLQILRNNLITRERFADDLIQRRVAELSKSAETPTANKPPVTLGAVDIVVDDDFKKPIPVVTTPPNSDPAALDEPPSTLTPSAEPGLPLPNPENPLIAAPAKSPAAPVTPNAAPGAATRADLFLPKGATPPAPKPASLAADLARKLFDVEPSLTTSPATTVEPQWSTWWLPESQSRPSPEPRPLPR